MSTGIRTTLVSPSTQTNRQMTMIRYGCRTANEGIEVTYLHFWWARPSFGETSSPGLYCPRLPKITDSFSSRPEVISTSVADCSPKVTLRLSILFPGPTTMTIPFPFFRGLDCLDRHGQNIRGGVEGNLYGGVHSGNQFVFGIRNIHFGMHGSRRSVSI